MFSANWQSNKYLGVAFTSDEKQDKELDVWLCKANAVMQVLHIHDVKVDIPPKLPVLISGND